MAGGERGPGGSSQARIYLLILLSTAFWGGTPVAGKLAIQDIPPMTVGVLRYGLASLLLVLLFRRHLPAWGMLRRSDLWTLLGVGVLGTFLNHILFFLGLLFAPASHGAIIPPTTSPIWTMLLAWWVLGERLTPLQLFGGLLTVGGVWVCQGPVAMQAAWRQARVRLGGEQAAAPEKR